MNQEELNIILEKHKKWLFQEKGGEQADLSWADLCRANLRRADLSWADLRWANLNGADLNGANLSWADLCRADLREADLRGADLRGADLRESKLDYSCLPLWLGSMNISVDKQIAAQIAAHFCALSCDDPDYLKAKEAILDFAKTSHIAKDLGLLIKACQDELEAQFKEEE